MARYQVHASYKISSVYIADGFADDCDELVHRCCHIKTLSYEKFCDIWKEMDFACVFHGRSMCSELAELSEEIIHIAKHYMVANTDSYEEAVAGLFLVYGLLNLQPISKFASLRLIPDDLPAIERLQSVARENRRLDVLYILGWVLITSTHYHAVQRQRGMEPPIRKYLDSLTTISKEGIRPKGVFYRQNEELDILRDLNRLGNSYKNAKDAVVGPNKSERNLNYVNDNLASELDTSLKNVINGITQKKNPDPKGEQRTIQELKEKAMKMPVKGMAHLTSIDDVIPRGRKRRPQRTRRTKGQPKIDPKRSKLEVSTDSDTSTDEEFSLGELDISDSEESSDLDESEEDQPNLKTQNECEIEIIDEFPDKETNPLISVLTDQMNLPELADAVEGTEENITEITDALQKRNVIMTKVVDSGQCEASTSDVSVVGEVAQVKPQRDFKKPETQLLEPKQKRDLKKAWIKTKFQRMGMLPVANFEDKVRNETE